MLSKINSIKESYALYKEGVKILEEQDVNVKDYDNQFAIYSKDMAWSFPFVARAVKLKQNKLIVL